METTYEVRYIDSLGRYVEETFDTKENANKRCRLLLDAGVEAEVWEVVK